MEIRRWHCERHLCDASATTIGTEAAQGLPEGWVVVYRDPPSHYCSDEHAREAAAAAIDVSEPWHRAAPFTLPTEGSDA
jgi:hypothetical protein